MIPWYTSKLVWLNVFLTLTGALTLVADAISKDSQMTIPGILMLVVGVIGVIMRVWFTDTTVDTPKAAAKIADKQSPFRPG